jgi:hypothetical protein
VRGQPYVRSFFCAVAAQSAKPCDGGRHEVANGVAWLGGVRLGLLVKAPRPPARAAKEHDALAVLHRPEQDRLDLAYNMRKQKGVQDCRTVYNTLQTDKVCEVLLDHVDEMPHAITIGHLLCALKTTLPNIEPDALTLAEASCVGDELAIATANVNQHVRVVYVCHVSDRGPDVLVCSNHGAAGTCICRRARRR